MLQNQAGCRTGEYGQRIVRKEMNSLGMTVKCGSRNIRENEYVRKKKYERGYEYVQLTWTFFDGKSLRSHGVEPDQIHFLQQNENLSLLGIVDHVHSDCRRLVVVEASSNRRKHGLSCVPSCG